MAVNWQRVSDLENIARAQNRLITPGEWAGAGGDWREYHTYTGGPQQSGPPARAFDFGAFDAIARRAASEGRRVTPAEYYSVGGTPELYNYMYPGSNLPPNIPSPAAPPIPEQVPADTALETPADVINTGMQVANLAQQQGNLLTNPNQVTPGGTYTVTIDPATGQPVITQALSPENQQILGGIQQGSVAANQALNQLIQGAYGALTTPAGEEGVAPASAYEEAVFGQLTRGLDEQQAENLEMTEQTLANRGIPVGGTAYLSTMEDLREYYDDRRDRARSQAVTQTQGMLNTALTQLSNLGQTGFYQPDFQAFQPVDYQQPDIGNIFNTLTQQAISMADIDMQKVLAGDRNELDRFIAELQARTQREIARMNASAIGAVGGGGGGGGEPEPERPRPSPFGPPPGG